MTIDVFTATGTKKGTLELPESIFGAPINKGLIHQAVVRQQSNARGAIAHVKTRGEVAGSTRKLYAQKHTGRARRGPIRSPLLKGGGKTFGPRNKANFEKDMPRAMRRAALISCLSSSAKHGAIVALEEYPKTIKTKDAVSLLRKMSLDDGRKALIVLPEAHESLTLSVRNIPGVKAVLFSYLSPVDVLGASRVIFLVDAIQKVAEWLGGKNEKMQKSQRNQKSEKNDQGTVSERMPKKTKTSSPTEAPPEEKARKIVRKKKSSASSDSSASSVSS